MQLFTISHPALNNNSEIYSFDLVFGIYVKQGQSQSASNNPDCVFPELYQNIVIQKIS